MIFTGDCREVMPFAGSFDMILADPPYGDTSLAWDRKVAGWEAVALECLRPGGSMWVFGSMRYFMAQGVPAGWKYAQDIVWEKHNGSGFAADRFKRVHEHVVHMYPARTKWARVYNEVQKTMDARAKVVRRKTRPTHTGHIDAAAYVSVDGGPRLMRSVVPVRSMHGRAIHPTEKPVELLETLVRTSCPPGGLVGDFFAGSGALWEACRNTGRQYVGCEIDEAMAEKARGRNAAP
jgi:site-specific DNA-methyltransferase (adenine-specific)